MVDCAYPRYALSALRVVSSVIPTITVLWTPGSSKMRFQRYISTLSSSKRDSNDTAVPWTLGVVPIMSPTIQQCSGPGVVPDVIPSMQQN